MGQYGHVGIVSVRPRVEVLNTGSLNSVLCMESQLGTSYPVVIGLFNVCFPRFPISHDLSRQSDDNDDFIT